MRYSLRQTSAFKRDYKRAKKRGYEVAILRSGTATVLPEKTAAKRQARLDAAGIEYI